MTRKIVIEVCGGMVSNVINMPNDTKYIIVDWDIPDDYEIINNLGLSDERYNFYKRLIDQQNLSFDEIINMAINEVVEAHYEN